jgi:hypothetical protein
LTCVAEYVYAHTYPVETGKQEHKPKPQTWGGGQTQPSRIAHNKIIQQRKDGAKEAADRPSDNSTQNSVISNIVKLGSDEPTEAGFECIPSIDRDLIEDGGIWVW